MSIEHSPGTSVLPAGAVCELSPPSTGSAEQGKSSAGCGTLAWGQALGTPGVAKELGRIATALEQMASDRAALNRIAGMLRHPGQGSYGPFDAENAVTIARDALGLPLATPAPPPIAAPGSSQEATGAFPSPAHDKLRASLTAYNGHFGDLGSIDDLAEAIGEHESLKRQLAEREGLLREVLEGWLPPEMRERIREALGKAKS